MPIDVAQGAPIFQVTLALPFPDSNNLGSQSFPYIRASVVRQLHLMFVFYQATSENANHIILHHRRTKPTNTLPTLHG